jgi:hypothetical protein
MQNVETNSYWVGAKNRLSSSWSIVNWFYSLACKVGTLVPNLSSLNIWRRVVFPALSNPRSNNFPDFFAKPGDEKLLVYCSNVWCKIELRHNNSSYIPQIMTYNHENSLHYVYKRQVLNKFAWIDDKDRVSAKIENHHFQIERKASIIIYQDVKSD